MSGKDGYLTTHILDTAKGCPAADVAIELFRPGGEKRELLNRLRTNNDGRTDEPILKPGQLQAGQYELVFHIGDYFDSGSMGINAFLDLVPIRFGISDESAHYHIPLLASPYGYTTYRGS